MASSTELSIVIRAKNAAREVLAQLDAQMKELAAKAQRYHAELRTVGIALTAVAVIGAGALAVAVKSAGDLELQMFNVRKTTDMAAQEIDRLKKSFIDMSAHLPVSAVELAKIGAVAGQLGVNGRKNIESFTETVAMISTVTDLTVEAAANSMARLANLFQMPIADIRKLGGVINEMENTTTAKASGMVEFMLRMATASKTLGMKAPDVAALSATLIDLGFNAELAGTAMSTAFNDMIKDADKFGLSMGITGAQFRKGMETDAIGTFQKWAQAMNALPKEEMLRTFDELGLSASRETSVFMSLVGAADKLAVNVKKANEEFKSGTSLQKEFDTFMQATWNQVKLLTNVMQGLAAMMGEVLLPILKSAAGVGQEFFLWLQGLPDWVRTAGLSLVMFGTAVTGLLGGLALFGAILPSLQAGLALIGTMAVAAAPLLGSLALAIGGVVAASVPLLGALALAIGGVTWAWTEWSKVNPSENEKAYQETLKNTAALEEKAVAIKNKRGKAIQDNGAALEHMAKSALSAKIALDEAFKTLGVTRVAEEIKKLEEAYKTLSASGKASGEEISQAWDNKEEKAAKLRGEVDLLAEAFETLGAESIQTVTDNLDELESAYKTVKVSGEASAITIAQAWIKVHDAQEKVNDPVREYEKIISSRVLPAVNAYVSAMQSAATATASASRTVFDTKLKNIADEAKNAGNSIKLIDSAMTNKFAAESRTAEIYARSIGEIRKASNAYADDLDSLGNRQMTQYQNLIAKLREVGAADRQVKEYELAAGKDYLSLLELRLSAERAGLEQLTKIRDENIAQYKKHKEAIKSLNDQAWEVDKQAWELADALDDKRYTEEENTIRQLGRLETTMSEAEWLNTDRKLQAMGEIGQKAAQLARSAEAGSEAEIYASNLAQTAYARKYALIVETAMANEKAAVAAQKIAAEADLAIARQQELVSGLATAVQTLAKTIADSALTVKITLIDEALEPAKALKAELNGIFGKDIVQRVTIISATVSTNTGNTEVGESGGGEGDSLPSYAVGIGYVPRDQIAQIHKGEAVLTRQEADRYRSGKSGNVTFGDIIIQPAKGVEITSAVAMEIRKKLDQLGRQIR